MKAFQNVDGGVILSVREYDIAAATVITEGQIVKLSGGKVVVAAAAETGAILGVAAETHSGAEDAINPRANGTRILVYDNPHLVMQCKAPQVAATGGSTTTFVSTNLAAFANDDMNGGYIKLVSLGDESTNTDAIGTVREITDHVGADKTLTVAAGGKICAGDVYEIYPPIGFAKGNLDTNIQALVLGATAALPLKVVQNDRNGYIGLMASLHTLAN